MTASEPQILRYTRWLREQRGLEFDPTTPAGYERFWRWSCDDLRGFWQSIFDFFGIESPTPHETVLVAETMPGAKWFPGARVNYAQHVFRHAAASDAAGHPAIVFRDETMQAHGETLAISWAELRRQVASFAAALRGMGIAPGDRVCAILPNLPQTAIAFLACASLGAVWSVCSADMGPLAILDRFRQIEPKVVIGVDGYVYGGVAADRLPVLRGLIDELPSVRHAVLLRHLDAEADVGSLAGPARAAHDFDALVAGRPCRSSRPGCPSTIRSGSSTRAAPPACRRRSSTATAG